MTLEGLPRVRHRQGAVDSTSIHHGAHRRWWQVRIPMLKVTGADGSIQNVSSNKEKGEVLHHMFFPDKPTGLYTPHDPEYPDWVDYNFQPLMAQLRCCIVRL